jgi:hypothetical protein
MFGMRDDDEDKQWRWKCKAEHVALDAGGWIAVVVGHLRMGRARIGEGGGIRGSWLIWEAARPGNVSQGSWTFLRWRIIQRKWTARNFKSWRGKEHFIVEIITGNKPFPFVLISSPYFHHLVASKHPALERTISALLLQP